MLNKIFTMNKYKFIFPALASALSLIFSFVPVIYLAWIPKYQPVGLYFLLDFALVIFFVFLGITAFSLLIRIIQGIMKKSPFFKWYDALFFFLLACLWGGATYNYLDISYTKFPGDSNSVVGFYGFCFPMEFVRHNIYNELITFQSTYVNFEFTVSIIACIITFTLFFVFLQKQKRKSALLDNDIHMTE